MIISKKHITLAEVKDLVKDSEDKQPLQDYLKSFAKLTKDKSEKLKSDLLALNNLKINEEELIKIVDFLPRDKEDVNKIFVDTSLTDEETNAILEITTKY